MLDEVSATNIEIKAAKYWLPVLGYHGPTVRCWTTGDMLIMMAINMLWGTLRKGHHEAP